MALAIHLVLYRVALNLPHPVLNTTNRDTFEHPGDDSDDGDGGFAVWDYSPEKQPRRRFAVLDSSSTKFEKSINNCLFFNEKNLNDTESCCLK